MSSPSLSAPPEPEIKPTPVSIPLPSAPPAPPPKRRRPLRLVALVFGAVAAAIFFFGRHERGADENAKSTVAVAKVEREDLVNDLWLSAEFRPFQEVSLHAKVAGYLKTISVDVGSEVKAGDKIAELEVPELEDEMAKAKSALQASLQDVKKAEADFAQADVVYQRNLGVSKEHPKFVAQQQLDDERTKRDAMNAALGAAQQRVEEAQSELNKTKTLFDYATITVPFDGVITKRYADPGALIQAGTSSNTQSMPIVDLAQQSLLRLVFPVPESAAPLIKNDAPVEVSVTAINELFKGKIARFSDKVERDTRTMHTEVDVPNPNGHYKPGMYAFVRLILQEEKDALAVPVLAVATGDKPSVLVLNKDGVIEQRPVKLGLQTPDKVQIREGLAEGDLVIVGSRNTARPGQKAVGKLTETPKAN